MSIVDELELLLQHFDAVYGELSDENRKQLGAFLSKYPSMPTHPDEVKALNGDLLELQVQIPSLVVAPSHSGKLTRPPQPVTEKPVGNMLVALKAAYDSKQVIAQPMEKSDKKMDSQRGNSR